MAFGKISNTAESVSNNKYVGLAPVKVLAVNPTKAELEEIYGRSIDKEPSYVGVSTNQQGKEVPNARIDFIVKTDPSCGVETITKVSFFLHKEGRNNKDNTKIQVIDKYSRSAWVTQDEYRNHQIPVYKNGPANLDKDYRFMYRGEEELVNFIRIYLGIPNPTKYVNNAWIMIDNPQDAECTLDCIENYFKGDFSELKEVVKLGENNLIKVLLGVKHTEGGQYQDVYTRGFVSNRSNNYGKFFDSVKENQSNGAYPNTIFEFCDVKKYEVTPTNFESTSTGADELPFSVEPNSTPW